MCVLYHHTWINIHTLWSIGRPCLVPCCAVCELKTVIFFFFAMFTFHKYLSIEWSLSFHFQNLHFYNSILQSRVHWPLSWKALRTLASCEAVGKVIMCLNFCFSFVDGKNSTWQHRVNLSTRWCSTCLLFCAWDSFVAYQYLTVSQRGWFLFTFYIWFSNGRGTLCSFSLLTKSLFSLRKISAG